MQDTTEVDIEIEDSYEVLVEVESQIVKEEEEDLQTEEEITRCVCGLQDSNGTWIQCKECLVWQHCECVNVQKIPKHYYCEECRPNGHPYYSSQSTRTTKKSRNTNNSRNDQDLERILKESMEDVSGGGGGDSAHFGGGVASVANVASVGGVEGSVEGGTNTTEEEEKLDSFADEVSDLVPVIEDPVHEPPESKVEIEAMEKVEPKEEEPIKKIMTPKRSKSSRKPQKKQKHQDSESDRDSFSTHHNKKPVKKLSEMHKRVQNMLDYLQTQKDVCVSEDGGDVWEEGEEELVGEVDEVATLVHDALVRFQQSY